MESEEIVLTYKSATLRKKDISFLNDGNWLNDQVINFYYEYLASNLSVDATDEDKRIVLMDPASVGLMLYTEDLEDLFDIFQPLELDHAGIIFCPINDNKNKFKQSGGNHWALVVYLRCTDKFYYFDSGSGFISHVPKIIAKLRCLILNDMDIKHLLAEADEIVEMPNAPKQTNSYDCGVYVLAMTNEILNIYIEDNGWVGMNFENNHLRIYNMIDIDFEENVNPTSIKELRKEIKDIIKSMIKK